MANLFTRFGRVDPTARPDERSIIERSVSFLLLGLICIFALNSIGNVQKYVHEYHHHWTGDALGIAFGTVVFVCAYVAATTGGPTRWVSILIGAVFGVASAYFQTELYISEGMKASTAHSLSYIPILAGEVGLALLESLYSKQHKQQSAATTIAELQAQLQAKTAELTALNAARLTAQPAAGAHTLSRPAGAAVASADGNGQPIATSWPQARSANGHVPVAQGATPVTALPQRVGDLDAANEIRVALKQQRKAAIPQVLAEAKRALTTSELAAALQGTYGWAVSSDSVRRYCQELVEEHILESVNRKWQRCAR